jgi:hypothetical protein
MSTIVENAERGVYIPLYIVFVARALTVAIMLHALLLFFLLGTAA